MKWKQNREITDDFVEEVANDLGVTFLQARILLNRNNDIDFARYVFRDHAEAISDPALLHNGEKVAERVAHYIRNGYTIMIHADYDSDGINSGFTAEDALNDIAKYVGSKSIIKTYYPNRVDGYGLSNAFANKIIKRKNETGETILVITVDNGIAQIEPVKLLNEADIEVIVTDHHQSKEVIPKCLICDPHNLHEEQDTYKHLCGMAVTFKICELVQKCFGYHDMTKYVPNLAIATITDVMPLTAENINFIHYGLEIMNSEQCSMGIKVMKEFLGIENINPMQIAWEIGPRINACGRMGHTEIGAELFKVKDYNEAVDLVNLIESINDERKERTKEAVAQLDKMNFDNDLFCVIELENVPVGIVGIVAGRAVEKYKKPCLVVTNHDGKCGGSARSIPGIDLHYLFGVEKKKGNIEDFGGHKEAAGAHFNENKKACLIEGLNNTMTSLIERASSENEFDLFEPIEEELLIDGIIQISDLNKTTFNLINTLPYNQTNFKKPILAITDCKVKDYIPTKTNPDNIWLTLQQGKNTVKLWCQGMTNRYKELGCPQKIHIAGSIEKNFMVGKPYIIKAVDLLAAE